MMMQAISNPNSRVGKIAIIASTSPGRKPRTGMDCSTSRIGIITFSALALRAAIVP